MSEMITNLLVFAVIVLAWRLEYLYETPLNDNQLKKRIAKLTKERYADTGNPVIYDKIQNISKDFVKKYPKFRTEYNRADISFLTIRGYSHIYSLFLEELGYRFIKDFRHRRMLMAIYRNIQKQFQGLLDPYMMGEFPNR